MFADTSGHSPHYWAKSVLSTDTPRGRCRFCSRPRQWNEHPNKRSRNLLAGGGSCVQFVKHTTSVTCNKVSIIKRGLPALCLVNYEVTWSVGMELCPTLFEPRGPFQGVLAPALVSSLRLVPWPALSWSIKMVPVQTPRLLSACLSPLWSCALCILATLTCSDSFQLGAMVRLHLDAPVPPPQPASSPSAVISFVPHLSGITFFNS